jgi:hypothetical protein
VITIKINAVFLVAIEEPITTLIIVLVEVMAEKKKLSIIKMN